MKRKNFEYSLPNGYVLAKKMDAADLGFGLILTIGSLLFFAVCIVVLAIPIFTNQDKLQSFKPDSLLFILSAYLVGTLIYMVLHELVHGVAYKSMTGEKLTFGIKWNCAYCGVPNILTYRKTSLVALYAPFLLFSLIFVPITLWAWWYSIEIYITIALLFATHISGCIGDLYMGHILLTEHKDKTTLLNDTGPCVHIFTYDVTNIGTIDPKTEQFKMKFNENKK